MARFVFAVCESVDWKWTPSDVLEQPEALLSDVLTLGGLNAKIKQIMDRTRQGKV